MTNIKKETPEEIGRIFYRLKKDENKKFKNDLIECWKRINDNRENEAEFTTKEGILENYYLCLLLNEYYFYKNNIELDFDENFIKSINGSVPFLYENLKDLEIDPSLFKTPAFFYYSLPIDVGELIKGNGFDKGTWIIDCYDMTSRRPFNGMKKFISYIYFNMLVENKEYEKAREVAEQSIPTIKNIIENYDDKEFNDSFIMNAIIKDDIELVLEEHVPYNKLEENREYTIAEKLSQLPKDKFALYVIPTVKLLTNYYRTLDDSDYKEFILYLILNLPETEESRKLLIEEKDKEFNSKLEELTRETIDEVLNDDEYAVKLKDIANNAQKSAIFDNLEYLHPFINFKNLQVLTRDYVATGNYVYEMFKKLDNKDHVDFGPAVIEWCKAVENEFRKKLTNPLDDEIIAELNNKGVIIYKNEKLVLGKAGHLKEHAKFLYERKYRYIYERINDIEFYRNIFELVEKMNNYYRRVSAHGGKQVDFINAQECQKLVLDSTKILEQLSKIPLVKRA